MITLKGMGVFQAMDPATVIALIAVLTGIGFIVRLLLFPLGARMDTLEGRMDSLEGRMDSLEGRMDSLEAGQAAIKAEIKSLEAGQAAIKADMAEIKSLLLSQFRPAPAE